MEFNIGERVRIKPYNEIPEGYKTKRFGALEGYEGEIVDKLYSEAKGCTVYKIHFDGYDRPSTSDFFEESFYSIADEEAKYDYEIEFLENLVVARLYEITDEGKVEIAKGHGHIFHDGVYGIAQATSYALKKICDNLNGGSLKSYRNN
jgi:hypothetical protein